MTGTAMPPRQGSAAARVGRGLVAAANWVSAASGGIAILGMTALVTVDVVGRYAFGAPLGVALEFSGYFLVALIFLGLAHSELRDRHIAITLLTDRLPPRPRRVMALAITLISLAFVTWLAWFTLQPALQDRALGTVSLSGTRTPQWIPQLAIPLGLALFAVLLVRRAAKQIADLRAGPKEDSHAE